ncbi:MAG: phasin family protein [Pseudomonadota bacterium]
MAKKIETPVIEPALDPAKLLETARETAEQNLSAVKANFEKTQTVLTTLQKDAEQGLESVQAKSGKVSMALIDTVRSNTEAGLKHAEKLVGVKSVAELIELQTGFVRAQAENALETAKSLQALTQNTAKELLEEAKTATEKTVSEFRKFA